MKIQTLISLAIALPLSACVVVSGDTDSATDGTTSASSSSTGSSTGADSETSSATTTASGTDSDSDSAGSTTADATATDPTSTSGSTTADSDSDSAGTGGDAAAILESCEAACESLLECYPDEFESLDFCVGLCVDESTPPELDAECEAATIAVNTCIGASSCDDLESRDFCGAEQDAADLACDSGEDDCFGGGGGNEEGTECEYFEECVGEYNHEFFCTVDTCECFEDGEKTQECAPQMNLCAEFDPSVLEDYSLECCGW
jgi:clumping factor A